MADARTVRPLDPGFTPTALNHAAHQAEERVLIADALGIADTARANS
jgi:hypothetical protein